QSHLRRNSGELPTIGAGRLPAGGGWPVEPGRIVPGSRKSKRCSKFRTTLLGIVQQPLCRRRSFLSRCDHSAGILSQQSTAIYATAWAADGYVSLPGQGTRRRLGCLVYSGRSRASESKPNVPAVNLGE